jgi:hypothetical protein
MTAHPSSPLSESGWQEKGNRRRKHVAHKLEPKSAQCRDMLATCGKWPDFCLVDLDTGTSSRRTSTDSGPDTKIKSTTNGGHVSSSEVLDTMLMRQHFRTRGKASVCKGTKNAPDQHHHVHASLGKSAIDLGTSTTLRHGPRSE